MAARAAHAGRVGAALAGLVACALAASWPAPAAADVLPTGRLSGVMGVKTGTGRLANDIGIGYAIGLEAGYAPMDADQRLGLGVSWSAVWSWYGGGARVADRLAMVELDLGLRVRAVLGASRRQVLFLGGGGGLLRTNEPILPGGARDHVTPWAAAGVEGLAAGWLWGISARYGLLSDGQGTFGVLIRLGGGR